MAQPYRLDFARAIGGYRSEGSSMPEEVPTGHPLP